MTGPVAGASFPDHFSAVSSSYAAYRPSYPEALFDALTDIAPSCALAWDCGAGTGQASVALAHRFTAVLATDASTSQISQAIPHERVTYRVAAAHESGLEDGSVGLVVVAQALHWFDVDAFHAEAKRVLLPHGVIAEWSYALVQVPSAPVVSSLLAGLDQDVGKWWPDERKHIETGYESLDFPFAKVDLGAFVMEADWTLEDLLGYLGTWSAVTRCRAETGKDPLESLTVKLAIAWGSVGHHRMRWPLQLRVGHNIPKPVELATSSKRAKE